MWRQSTTPAPPAAPAAPRSPQSSLHSAYTSGSEAARPPATRLPGFRRVYWQLWLTFGFFVGSVELGLAWDRGWHATHTFDTFFSPPHIFTYTMVAITTLLVAWLAFSERTRIWFGAGWRISLPPLELAVPGPLIVTGGGLATLGLAGMLDALWHSNFGLDETGWSTPHAMIGWGLCITAFGFISCRLALRCYRPLHWYSVLVLSSLAFGFSFAPFTGPLGSNHAPELLKAVAHVPVLLEQPAVQHTFRIEQTWNLTRTNPLFVPLAALWAGVALAFVRNLDRRWWVFLAAVALWSLLTLSSGRDDVRGLASFLHVRGQDAAIDFSIRDAALWLPPPVLPAALTLLLGRLIQLRERWAWALAGVVFGLFASWTWDPHVLLVPLALVAAPLLLAGALLGEWVYRGLAQPAARKVGTLLLAGICVPFVVGLIDLYLRSVTP